MADQELTQRTEITHILINGHIRWEERDLLNTLLEQIQYLPGLLEPIKGMSIRRYVQVCGSQPWKFYIYDHYFDSKRELFISETNKMRLYHQKEIEALNIKPLLNP